MLKHLGKEYGRRQYAMALQELDELARRRHTYALRQVFSLASLSQLRVADSESPIGISTASTEGFGSKSSISSADE